MRLSDYKGEEALDLIADLMEPVSKILEDKEFQKQVEGGDNAGMLKAAKILLKHHKRECIEILARIDGIPFEQYNPTVFTLTKKVVELLGDKEVQELFTSQGQIEEAANFGSATENIEDAGK